MFCLLNKSIYSKLLKKIQITIKINMEENKEINNKFKEKNVKDSEKNSTTENVDCSKENSFKNEPETQEEFNKNPNSILKFYKNNNFEYYDSTDDLISIIYEEDDSKNYKKHVKFNEVPKIFEYEV